MRINSIDEIYACHILEHFGRNDNYRVLNEWKRVLKPGGTLRIAMPDFKAIAMEYIEHGEEIERIIGLLYGGKNYEYNFHYQFFDYDRLAKILAKIEFENIPIYDWRNFLPDDFDDYSSVYTSYGL